MFEIPSRGDKMLRNSSAAKWPQVFKWLLLYNERTSDTFSW